jgi:hypothetical protein
MFGDLEDFIVLIPFLYLGLAVVAYFIMRKKFP